MEIAKGIRSSDYKKLNLSDYDSNDWLIAFDYLKRRLSERFIEPVEALIASEKGKTPFERKFGFAILAIDCMLAETIQSFYEGVTDSAGQSRKLFQRFLRNRENFQSHFKTDEEAADFYKNFRCGILHQAQTTGDTRVWTVGRLIERIDGAVIVNRDVFHEKIKEELKVYLSELQKRSNHVLLDKFKDKMDFIAGS